MNASRIQNTNTFDGKQIGEIYFYKSIHLGVLCDTKLDDCSSSVSSMIQADQKFT